MEYIYKCSECHKEIKYIKKEMIYKPCKCYSSVYKEEINVINNKCNNGIHNMNCNKYIKRNHCNKLLSKIEEIL